MKDCKKNVGKDVRNLVKNLLSETLRDIMSIVKADRGSLFLFDSKTKRLVLDAFYGVNNLNPGGIEHRIGEGVSGKVVSIKTPVLVKDINYDLRFMRPNAYKYVTNSFISIPLFDSHGLLGVLNIADKSSGKPFSEKDLTFAVTLCRYACLLADNLLHSERLKQERDDFNRHKQILEKYASVGKLAAGIVHEVNNPLDGIIRYTNMLLFQMEKNLISKEYLVEIKKGLNKIANITKSLREFSRQVNSERSGENIYVYVDSLIENALEVFNVALKNNIKVEKRFKTPVPRVKDLGLSHVFINIIKNALDAMPQGGKLEISIDVNGAGMEIRFSDTGRGVPEEIKERIFEPFFTTKSAEEGTGLGLAISKEIVNKYEGRISVQSVCGKGSAFAVLIPKKYLG